jgi:glycosyltransferase involved in cell wall biosynthesis
LKRALIISYYWPPSGGSGVQRWLKFTKYLPEFGITPIVYTPENPEFPEFDSSLEKSISKETIILKTKIWEPYAIYKLLTGKKQSTKLSASFAKEKKGSSLLERLSIWIRGNFLIPDPRVFWVRKSIKYLEAYLKENPVDAVISSGPPHSMHLIAMGLKERLGLKWIADFRDPWTQIDFYHELQLTKWGDAKHRRLEKKVLESADKIIVVGEGMKTDFLSLNYRLNPENIEVIHNGYDENDFEQKIDNVVQLDDKFSIVHIGTLGAARNPHTLWKALSELLREEPKLKDQLHIRFVGKTDFSVKESLEKFDLLNYAEFINYVPHSDVVGYQKSARLLLLLINNTPNAKSIITGKFFEYLVSGRPIFAVGLKDSEINTIINKTECGTLCDFNDLIETKSAIVSAFSSYLDGRDKYFGNFHVKNFTRKNLTKKLVSII